MQVQPTTLEKIASLEQARIDLLNDTDSELATFHNAARLKRLYDIKVELDQLWTIERQHRASKRSQQSKSARR